VTNWTNHDFSRKKDFLTGCIAKKTDLGINWSIGDDDDLAHMGGDPPAIFIHSDPED
jgi:hypothetical protein